jgi:hypothetical protein
VLTALDVPGLELQQLAPLHFLTRDDRGGQVDAVVGHMVPQPDDVAGREIRTGRPRLVEVSDREADVRQP